MNKDLLNATKDEMVKSIESGDTKAFAGQVVDMFGKAKEETLALYNELKNEKDERILAQRGVFKLTSEEKNFYNAVIESVKNEGEGVNNIPLLLPITVVDRVFEEIQTEHPLLSKIDFIDTKGVLEFDLTTGKRGVAAWGDLCSAITAQAGTDFGKVSITLKKLTIAMPVCLTAIELGMVWLDRYVRTVLAELIADELCDAIINGDGAGKPIGMKKVIAAPGATQTIPAVDKAAAAITALDVATLGAIASELTNGGKRKVGRILMVVNPLDYEEKVAPAVTVMNGLGEYVVRTPRPMDIVEDANVPVGEAIFGIAKNYWAGVGLGKVPKITYSDEFKFLDDVRWYKSKLTANGQPRDNASFVVKDITGLTPAYITVKNV